MGEGWSFSDVDGAGDAGEVARRLDLAAEDLADTKTRLTALLGPTVDGRWLDLGCGVGHDLGGRGDLDGRDDLGGRRDLGGRDLRSGRGDLGGRDERSGRGDLGGRDLRSGRGDLGGREDPGGLGDRDGREGPGGLGGRSDLRERGTAVGLDLGVAMVAEARRRRPGARLVAGDGHALPFASASFDGCRIERVLQHVADPYRVLAEVRRCLRAGGRVAVFDPDWSSLRFGASDEVVSAAVVGSVVERHRQGAVGAQLGDLLVAAGFVAAVVEPETVSWSSLDGIRRSFRFDEGVERAKATVGPHRVGGWLAELGELESTGRLRVQFTRYYAAGTGPPSRIPRQ